MNALLNQTYESLSSYLDQLPGSRRDFPFGIDVLVYKLGGKMFALMSWQENPVKLSLKCDPEEALRLRELYPAVVPGYHLNKLHWNTLTCDDSVPDDVVKDMIDKSYELIWQSLPANIHKQFDTGEHGEA